MTALPTCAMQFQLNLAHAVLGYASARSFALCRNTNSILLHTNVRLYPTQTIIFEYIPSMFCRVQTIIDFKYSSRRCIKQAHTKHLHSSTVKVVPNSSLLTSVVTASMLTCKRSIPNMQLSLGVRWSVILANNSALFANSRGILLSLNPSAKSRWSSVNPKG